MYRFLDDELGVTVAENLRVLAARDLLRIIPFLKAVSAVAFREALLLPSDDEVYKT